MRSIIRANSSADLKALQQSEARTCHSVLEIVTGIPHQKKFKSKRVHHRQPALNSCDLLEFLGEPTVPFSVDLFSLVVKYVGHLCHPFDLAVQIARVHQVSKISHHKPDTWTSKTSNNPLLHPRFKLSCGNSLGFSPKFSSYFHRTQPR